MSRWQLRAIVLYSHDGRRRDLFFDLNSVNIVTGPSGSGKSALCEIIDYCFGSGQCHIPGVVRYASAWVGILLASDTTQAFIARRIPPPHQLSSEDTYLSFGVHIDIPAAARDLTGTTNVSTMLRRLEQLLGIGNVVTEVFGATRPQRKVTARNLTPFLLQDDDVIINKTVLLRGAQDDHRLSIIDTFPYFLGTVDESIIAKEQELRRLTSQAAAEQRRIAQSERLRDTAALSLRGLATEAQQVGLLDLSVEDASVETLRSALQTVATWTPSSESEQGTDRLSQLSAREHQLQVQRTALLAEMEDVREAHRQASTFVTTAERQQRRLQVVDLFNANGGPVQTCPVCQNPLMQHTDTLAAVQAAYRELQSQLRLANRERPQIDLYITTLQDRIDALASQQAIVRQQLLAIRRESQAIQQQLDLTQRRMRVVGRVSYFLEMADETETAPNLDLLHQLEARLAELREELDNSNKMDRLLEAQQQVALSATEILADLPFTALYPQRTVYMSTRDLSAGILTAQRRIPMRDIGSDENYLSLHVAVALALHRYFKNHERPVPGFIVFDQLSRPFYPPDKMPGVVTTRSDAERVELRRYFDLLFKEVAEQKDFQVIVLEHAFFADDKRFTKAVGDRFFEKDKLIPADWPIISE
jgi:Protein of unknown function (DUF3732)